jgi:high-affinity iron transporter
MATAFLIMVREGFEAALVVAIVFAYLRRVERMDLSGAVWGGVAAASALALGFGVAIHLTTGSLVGANRLRAFAAVSIVALVVLTWMVFWMRRASRAIKNDLEHKVDHALAQGGAHVQRAVAMVAFFAVLREGMEASLFLIAAATEAAGRQVLVGGLMGLAVAAGAAWLVYMGGRRLPMRQFFTVTGMVLIVFAAGLAAKSVGFLQAAGDLRSFNLNGVYDLRSVAWLNPGDSEIGKFLAAMVGWDPRPSVEQVVAWFGYFVPVTILFLRPGRPATTEPRRPAVTGESAPEAEAVAAAH